MSKKTGKSKKGGKDKKRQGKGSNGTKQGDAKKTIGTRTGSPRKK